MPYVFLFAILWIMMQILEKNNIFEYYNILFKEYPDVVKVKTLKEMLPKIGKNKLYKLLKDKEIYSKRKSSGQRCTCKEAGDQGQ